MELNKKELKKMSHSFNTIANRIMRVAYDEYGMILKKFLAFIEVNEIILKESIIVRAVKKRTDLQNVKLL